ncbi:MULTISPECIES: aldehyde dehydrogenase family protein [Bradyrhizobium]|uniref:3-succinoylsemialdehyde-pyridine dehydrogenase n=1 Tax=Bradyrhizobium vignae TaxID=1549949 RepID=A0A2U3Q3G8_9BRAD|nr:aldehyde dehydrogenase family protein [Bradyrhizobium vignae]SPP95916.1 3-succinoylsemialdehyde-pyridine dehydrogenase [Bradyrhizobium vignae]
MNIDEIYIDGRFVEPHGTELFDLHNPFTGELTGTVRLGDREDAKAAIAAAGRAFPAWSRTDKAERIALLHRMHEAVTRHKDRLQDAIAQEFGAPVARSGFMVTHAADAYRHAADALEQTELELSVGQSRVRMMPIGVAALIMPWNNNAGFIGTKLAYALAAGCTAVLKPSEMSAWQTQVLVEALHEAGAPPGVFNVVTGRGDVVGAEFTVNSGVAKISFTGSTPVGKSIQRAAVDTMKRVTLELGGKSPTIVLDDVDFASMIPVAARIGMGNSGQACVNGTRILVPASRRDEAVAALKAAVEQMTSGDPRDPETVIGPMVSRTQYDRVQHYIRAGIDAGATLVTGGEGHPEGTGGFCVRPTLFADVTNDMVIAREEIFGPVLCVLTYRDDEEAIRIANDTPYGLCAYILGQDTKRIHAIADRLEAGTIGINGAAPDVRAPFGGVKQSGIGREFGIFGLQSYLEPKTLLESVPA